MVNKRFIADLMPKHPIYVPLLPEAARNVVGEVHEHTRPALRILQDENFECCDMVDIFEAGPVVRCALPDIRTVRESRKAKIAALSDTPIESEPMLISNGRDTFRAAIGTVHIDDGAATIATELATALKVNVGDAVRFAPLRHRPAQRYHDANVSFD
jgi:arginine N-succinyltransferase